MVVVGEDALEVAAGLSVGDQLDEEGVVGRGAVEPDAGVAGAGVVTGEGGYVVAADKVAHPAQVVCAELNVDEGQVEQGGGIVGVVEALGDLRPGAGDDLGEAVGAGKGAGGRLKEALLEDETVEEEGVDVKISGLLLDDARSNVWDRRLAGRKSGASATWRAGLGLSDAPLLGRGAVMR